MQTDCRLTNCTGNSQNRRQIVFNRGVCVSAGGLCVFAGGLTKTPLIYSVSCFNLRGHGALFGGAKPTKVPVATGRQLPLKKVKFMKFGVKKANLETLGSSHAAKK